MSHRKAVGKRLREARRSANLNQIDVEKKTGIKQSRLSRIEAGVLELSFEEATKVARVCGITLTQLAGAA